MYVFYDKGWKFFGKNMTILEKVSYIKIKKVIVNLNIAKDI